MTVPGKNAVSKKLLPFVLSRLHHLREIPRSVMETLLNQTLNKQQHTTRNLEIGLRFKHRKGSATQQIQVNGIDSEEENIQTIRNTPLLADAVS